MNTRAQTVQPGDITHQSTGPYAKRCGLNLWSFFFASRPVFIFVVDWHHLSLCAWLICHLSSLRWFRTVATSFISSHRQPYTPVSAMLQKKKSVQRTHCISDGSCWEIILIKQIIKSFTGNILFEQRYRFFGLGCPSLYQDKRQEENEKPAIYRSVFVLFLSFDLIKAGATQTKTPLLKEYEGGECVGLLNEYPLHLVLSTSRHTFVMECCTQWSACCTFWVNFNAGWCKNVGLTGMKNMGKTNLLKPVSIRIP